MIKRAAVRGSGVLVVGLLCGCGTNALLVVPEDCVLFSRTEARAWFDDAQAEQAEGASELEAFGTVLLECVTGNCEGNSAGACAVACAACADALVTLVYAPDEGP